MGRNTFLAKLTQYRAAVAAATGVPMRSVYVTTVTEVSIRRTRAMSRALALSVEVDTEVHVEEGSNPLTGSSNIDDVAQRLAEGRLQQALATQGLPAGHFSKFPVVTPG
eukprot:213130-Rhodomonas_salina.1